MKHDSLTRREFIGIAAGLTGLAALGGLACPMGSKVVPTPQHAAPGVARLQVRHPKKLRILQFTDLHFFAGEKPFHDILNRRTVETMQQLVKLAKPQLLMVTGDLWPEDRDHMGEKYMHYAIGQLEVLGVPWAFTWGNHDQLPDCAVGHAAFTEAPNSLYRGGATNGNYVIDIVNRHGNVVWQILCINSKGDGLDPKQQQWLRSLPKTPDVPRFAFFHVPLKQYADIWTNGAASGVKGEEVCLEKEDGSSLPLLKSLGVRACFCGHDHKNDYSGVIDGVELAYGRATGSGGYGAEILPKGGKLITLNCKSGRYSWVTLLPDGTKWHPKPGERIDETGRDKK